jgi:predicted RNase H-like nuclease (RuvC/YqgF family)
MNSFVNKLRQELESDDKSLVDFNRCLNLLEDIEDEMDMMESENQDLDSTNYDLERKIEDLEDELESFQIEQKGNPRTLDDIYKQEIFEKLSQKYPYYKLEEL